MKNYTKLFLESNMDADIYGHRISACIDDINRGCKTLLVIVDKNITEKDIVDLLNMFKSVINITDLKIEIVERETCLQ